MSLEVPHVLINIDDFSALLVNLVEEALNQLCEIRMLLLDDSVILLVLVPDVRKELFEVLRIIHDQLIDDSFMQVNAWEFV